MKNAFFTFWKLLHSLMEFLETKKSVFFRIFVHLGTPCPSGQSVSFRLVFASLNFSLAYYFYVVFRTLLPFIFFSSVFEAFDWPHWGSPEQLPWEIALQNLDRLPPQPFSLITENSTDVVRVGLAATASNSYVSKHQACDLPSAV